MDIEQGMSDEYILEQEAVQVEPAGGYGIFSAVAAILVPGGIIGSYSK